MRRFVVALLFMVVLGVGLRPSWAEEAAPSSGYRPPMRGAPEGRFGGASRGIAPTQNPSGAALTKDAALWQSIENSGNPADFEDFLLRFPNSDFAPLAEHHLATLKAGSAPISGK
ncbi:MAG TPA: hypothetical protein VMI30_04720 [Stellaceae bacterium]|nr:hypothetical protein [Stellaceae bacterium]